MCTVFICKLLDFFPPTLLKLHFVFTNCFLNSWNYITNTKILPFGLQVYVSVIYFNSLGRTLISTWFCWTPGLKLQNVDYSLKLLQTEKRLILEMIPTQEYKNCGNWSKHILDWQLCSKPTHAHWYNTHFHILY